ncbi:probable RNA-binding protein CG14230 [Dysidea avara]|uniref:probable RNA-binding protein CG14230 n=1 Tax=Dysidea avara TaxID=196820 RepID=UPI003325DE9E
MEQNRRLFISGIPPEASEHEIKQRFEAFGVVSSVEKLVKGREGFPTKCFAYLDISLTDASYRKCVSLYSKAKWKGSQMIIEPAKKNFLNCLKDERQQLAISKTPTKVSSPPPTIASELHVKSQDGKRLLNVNLKKNAKKVKKFAVQSLATDQVSVNDLSWDLEPVSEPCNVPSETSPPAKKIKEDKVSKRNASNKVRLKALEKSKEQRNKPRIVDEPQANSHIVFEPEEAKSSTDESSSENPKGKTSLPLFGSDSESDDDNDVVRPQFEGKEGAKLFKLQQKIGWDRRFELDERFLSSSSESSLSDSEDEASVEQEDTSLISDNDELKKERQRNLELINEMFGNASSVVTPRKHGGMIELQRYDPSAADSELLEKKPPPAKTKKTKIVTENTTVTPSETKKAEEAPKPVISQDHYYSVNNTLKDALRTDGEGYTFNFTTSTPKGVNGSKTAAGTTKTPSWLNALQNDDQDSSSTEEDTPDHPSTSDVQKRTSLFFFHSNSTELRNRLDAPETKFHRICSLEELEAKWPEKRTHLKDQYKRRRRDAIRWLRQRKQIK